MRVLILSFLFLFSFPVIAQDTFTYDQFIALVLEKDYGIQIVKNNAEISANENNVGNAGYLPQISVIADQNLTITSARQEFLSGQVNEADNAKNTSLSAGVLLNWTFFDGFKMFATDKKLDLLEESALLNLRAEMEMKVYQASVSFYTLVVLNEMNEIYEQSIDLSKARYDQVNLLVSNGAASDMELIQAQLDLTADSAVFLNNQRNIAAIQTSLNAFIARDAELPFTATGTLPEVTEAMNWEELVDKSMADNASLLYAKSALAISEQERKEVLSTWYPQLAIYAGYSYGRSQNEVGFLLSNQSIGPSFGLTLRWDILNGLSRIQNSKNSRLTIENSELAQKQQSQLIRSELREAFVNYEFTMKNLEFESRNQLVAEEVEKIIGTAFESGAYTALELREFQFAVVEARSRLLTAKLEYMTQRLNLLLLSGSL